MPVVSRDKALYPGPNVKLCVEEPYVPGFDGGLGMIEYLEPYELIEEKYARLGLSMDQVRECAEKATCNGRLLAEWDEVYYDVRDYDRLLKTPK